MTIDDRNPTPEQVRDDVARKLETYRLHNDSFCHGDPFKKVKPAGTDEVVLVHQSGRKFVVKVREVEG